MGASVRMSWRPPRSFMVAVALSALLVLSAVWPGAALPARAAGLPPSPSLRRLSPRPPRQPRRPIVSRPNVPRSAVPRPVRAPSVGRPAPRLGARPQLARTGLDVRLAVLIGIALLGAGIVVGARAAHDRRR